MKKKMGTIVETLAREKVAIYAPSTAAIALLAPIHGNSDWLLKKTCADDALVPQKDETVNGDNPYRNIRKSV
ncbi:MAG: hypothetical protein NUV86_02070 [Candidatus Scalindua sp.]|nr:hypothetical protein [Candidatus Scalindua sp.]MCR4343368.1 hypothetical protein [Candidatus Scalindua sp.]